MALNEGNRKSVALKNIIQETVAGLGYELVEVELTSTGLLRVTIDLLGNQSVPDVDAGFVVIEDCEKVSRQLSYVLTVEEIQYKRLEVSSPGLDRPLNKPSDFERFEGDVVKLKLAAAIGGRKHFEGILRIESAGNFALDWDEVVKEKLVTADAVVTSSDEKKSDEKKADVKKQKKRMSNAKRRAMIFDQDDPAQIARHQAAKLAAEQAGSQGKSVTVSKSLSFVFEDVEKANLVAQVEFGLGSESQDETP